MSKILLLTTGQCKEQTARAEEIGRELSDSRGVAAEVIGLFRGEAPDGRALPRRALKKQIADAVPVLLETLLRSRPGAVYCMHYAAAIAACEACRRGGLSIPVYASTRDRALLAPGIAAGFLSADPSELAELAAAQPPVPQPPAGQVSDRETVRRISRALKFAAKQAKLIRKYPFLTEEHLEWEL